MWPTAATAASRCSTPTASCCTQLKINVPVPANARPAIGAKPDLAACDRNGGTQCPGAPWAICITPAPNQVLYVADAFPGRIYKLSLDGKVLGVLGESGKQLKQFGWVHEIACPSENEIYVAEIAELARAEADPASGEGESGEPLNVTLWNCLARDELCLSRAFFCPDVQSWMNLLRASRD